MHGFKPGGFHHRHALLTTKAVVATVVIPYMDLSPVDSTAVKAYKECMGCNPPKVKPYKE